MIFIRSPHAARPLVRPRGDWQVARQPAHQLAEQVGLEGCDTAADLDHTGAKRARPVASHVFQQPFEERPPSAGETALALDMLEGDLRVVMRKVDFHLGFVVDEDRLRWLAQRAQEMLAPLGRDRIDLARTRPAPLGPHRDHAVAVELLERRVKRAVTGPVEKADRIAEAALDVVAGHRGLHQEAQDGELDVDARGLFGPVDFGRRHPAREGFFDRRRLTYKRRPGLSAFCFHRDLANLYNISTRYIDTRDEKRGANNDGSSVAPVKRRRDRCKRIDSASRRSSYEGASARGASALFKAIAVRARRRRDDRGPGAGTARCGNSPPWRFPRACPWPRSHRRGRR